MKKIDILRKHMTNKDWGKALAVAVKFPRLGAAKTAIERAHGMLTNPSFYKQLGYNEQETIQSGIDALIANYG